MITPTKKPSKHSLKGCAEREGFEPPDLLQSVVFKTTAIDHSAISPNLKLFPFSEVQI